MSKKQNYWEKVSEDLGIPIVCHVFVPGFESLGRVDAIIPYFGGGRGMIVVGDYEQLAKSAKSLIAEGYGYSVVEGGGSYDRKAAIEMLRDWAWTSSRRPPKWY